MPELPEVETVVRDLRPCVVGRRIVGVRVGKHSLRRPWRPAWRGQVLGRTILAITRRGKWILIDLGQPWLLVHLGMTGQFTVAPRTSPRPNHTHLVFAMDDGELRFRDVRRFGSVTLFADRSHLDAFFEKARLGPEPWDLCRADWALRLCRTRRSLKALLLDQTVVAGVGNIYADESLFEARLHPARSACDLTPAQQQRLREAIVAILDRAIERRGSTIRDYIGGSGLRGGFQGEFRVYGRGGQPCLRCGAAIQRMRLAGRSTHYCPACQGT